MREQVVLAVGRLDGDRKHDAGSVLAALPCGGTGLGVSCRAARKLPWYRRSLVGMEVGPTGAQFGNSDPADIRYCAKFDGRRDRAADAWRPAANTWSSGRATATRPTTIRSCCPNAPGSVTATAARGGRRGPQAQAAGDRLLRRATGQGTFCNAHPEFQARAANGKPHRPLLLQLRLPGGDETDRRRATGLRHGRIPHRHARPGLRPALRLLVRRLPQAVPGGVLPADAQRRDLGRGLGPDAGISLSHQRAFRAGAAAITSNRSTRGPRWTSIITAIRRSRGRWANARCSTPAIGDFVTGETGMWAFSALRSD